MVNKKKPTYRETVTDKAPQVDRKQKKPIKRNWQNHAKSQIKK